jgi:uncharacterized membrane protein
LAAGITPRLRFLLGLFVYYLLVIIPVIGWLVVPLVMLFGLGVELIARKQFTQLTEPRVESSGSQLDVND